MISRLTTELFSSIFSSKDHSRLGSGMRLGHSVLQTQFLVKILSENGLGITKRVDILVPCRVE